MSVSTVQEIIHPRALYERTPLPDSQNALSAWQAAGAAMVNAEELSKLASYGTECGCQEEGCPTSAPPTPVKFVARAGELLAANRESLEHIERVVEIGRLQVTVSPPDLCTLSEPPCVGRLMVLQGKRFAMLGDLPRAVAVYLRMLKLGAMLGNCDGTMSHWLHGSTVQDVAVRHLSELVKCDVPPKVKSEIAQALPLILDRESVARTMRSEFTSWTLPIIQPIVELTGEAALQKVLEIFYSGATDPESSLDFDWDSRLWSREMQLTIPMLLGDHARLWDARETVRGTSISYAAAVAVWLDDHELRESIRQEYANWRARCARFSTSFPQQCLSLFGAIDVDIFDKSKPFSARQFAETRIALRSIHNPLGLMVASFLEPGSGLNIFAPSPQRAAREAHLRAAVANA